MRAVRRLLALLGAARRPARRAKRDNFKKIMIKSYVSIQFFDVIFRIAAKYVLYSSLRSSLVRTSCEPLRGSMPPTEAGSHEPLRGSHGADFSDYNSSMVQKIQGR